MDKCKPKNMLNEIGGKVEWFKKYATKRLKEEGVSSVFLEGYFEGQLYVAENILLLIESGFKFEEEDEDL